MGDLLDDDEPLNDEVINSYMQLLDVSSPQEIRFGNSYLIPLVKRRMILKDEDQMYRLCKKYDLRSVKIWVLPVYLETFHWLLCVIYVRAHLMFFYDPYSSWKDRFSSSAEDIAQVADVIRYFFRFYARVVTKLSHLSCIPWAVSRPCFDPVQKDGVNCGVFALVVAEIFRELYIELGCLRIAPDFIRIEDISWQREHIRANVKAGTPCYSQIEKRGVSWKRVPVSHDDVISLRSDPRRLKLICDPFLTPTRPRILMTTQEKNWLTMRVIQSKDDISAQFSEGAAKDAIIYEQSSSDPEELTTVAAWVETSVFNGTHSLVGKKIRFTCYSSRSSTFMFERLLLEMFARLGAYKIDLSIVIPGISGDLDCRCEEGGFIVHSEDYDPGDKFYTTDGESLSQRTNLNDFLYCLGNSFPEHFLKIFVLRNGGDCIKDEDDYFDFLLDDNGMFGSNRESERYREILFSKKRNCVFVGLDPTKSEIQVIFPREWHHANSYCGDFHISTVNDITRLILPLSYSEVVLRTKYFPFKSGMTRISF